MSIPKCLIPGQGVTAYAISNNPTDEVQRFLAETIRPGEKVVLVDLGPNTKTLQLCRLLVQSGKEIVSYVDHHEDYLLSPSVQQEEMREAAEELRILLGDSFRLAKRLVYPSCVSLVEAGEWVNCGVTAAIFHRDLDGFLATLKGFGITYESMDEDADAVEGGQGSRLSPTGRLIVRLWRAAIRDTAWVAACSWAMEQCLKLLVGELSHREVWRLVRERARRRTQSTDDRAILTELTKLLPGRVAYIDYTVVRQRVGSVDFNAWRGLMLRTHGPLLLVEENFFDGKRVVYVRLPPAWSRHLDLGQFIDRTKAYKVSRNYLKLPTELFPQFLQSWQERWPMTEKYLSDVPQR